MPEVNHLGDKLEWPNYMETQLVSRIKTVQQMLNVYRANCPPHCRPLGFKTHGLAVASAEPVQLQSQLPVSAREVPKSLSVVFMNEVRDRAEMEQRLNSIAAVKVRGPVVTAWSHFVVHTNGTVELSPEALEEYRQPVYQQPGGGVPPELATSVFATQRADVAAMLQATFLRDRTGTAAVRQGEDQLMAATQLQGRDREQEQQAALPGAATGPFVGLVERPQLEPGSDEAAAAGSTDGVLEEIELVIPQAPPPAQPGSVHSDPDAVRELLGRGLIVHCAGGPNATILREDDPRSISDAFPTALPFAWGGQRPVCMSLPAYFRHLNARVPRRQFNGNPHLMVRMADMLVKHESRSSTAITARMAPEVVQQAGTLPRDFARQLAAILSLPSYDSRRQRVMDQGGSTLRSFMCGAEKVAGRVDMTDAYYRSAQQQLRCASLSLGLPMLWWNINPCDMYADAVVVASGQVSELRLGGVPASIPVFTSPGSGHEVAAREGSLRWRMHAIGTWTRRG